MVKMECSTWALYDGGFYGDTTNSQKVPPADTPDLASAPDVSHCYPQLETRS